MHELNGGTAYDVLVWHGGFLSNLIRTDIKFNFSQAVAPSCTDFTYLMDRMWNPNFVDNDRKSLKTMNRVILGFRIYETLLLVLHGLHKCDN